MHSEVSDRAAFSCLTFLYLVQKYYQVNFAILGFKICVGTKSRSANLRMTRTSLALGIVDDFLRYFGIETKYEKTKALWLRKWRNKRATLLQLSWPQDPVKILGIYFSFDENKAD